MPQGGIAEEHSFADSRASRLRERVDSFCQNAITAVVLAILVWAPLAMAANRLIDFVPVVLATALALGLWVVRFWTQKPFRLFWPPASWGVYAFVLYAVVRAQFVDIPYEAAREIVQIAVYAVLFLVVSNNLNRRESAEITVVTLITLGMLLSLLSIYQCATHNPRISVFWWALKPHNYWNRGSGTFVNPNSFGGFLALLIPLGVAYILLSRMSLTAKVILGYATAVMMAGLCCTLSRGAMAATAAALAFLCIALLFKGGSIYPPIIALVVICGTSIYVRDDVESIARRYDNSAQNGSVELDARQYYWQTALKVFGKDKTWGQGPAQFDQQYYFFHPEHIQSPLIYAHNDYLNTLADYGAFGLALIAIFISAIYYLAWRTWNSIRRKVSDVGSGHTDKGAFLMGGLFALSALLFHCIVDFDMHVPADALLAVSIMALLVAHGRYLTERYWKNPGAIGKFALAVACSGVVVFFIVVASKTGRAQHWVEKADVAERILNKHIDADTDSTNYEAAVASPERWAAFNGRLDDLKRAYEIDPTDAKVSFRIGESYWDIAAQGNRGYQTNTFEAMRWYSRAILNNPLDWLSFTQYGLCLDEIDRHNEATPYYNKAMQLNPNGWYPAFCRAKSLVDMDDLINAREMFITAYKRTAGNPMLWQYWQMVEQRITEEGKR